MSTLVQQFLYACILHLLYCFVLTNIHEIYMLKVEGNCWNLNLPLCWLNTFCLESIALWVNSYAKLLDACLESTIHEKFLLIWFSCLLIIYLLANYRPLTWITSFITCALQYYLIKIMIVACHLRNYFVFIVLPTRGRVKLGDAWYVSNVSIISDVPCWYYTNCYMFYIHFIAFLCIFWD